VLDGINPALRATDIAGAAAFSTAGPAPPDTCRRSARIYVSPSSRPKRDGELIAAPRVTYASYDAPSAVRDVYRDAVNGTLARCTPLHFSKDMGGAVAGQILSRSSRPCRACAASSVPRDTIRAAI
jgi:hypothetical protein